KRARRRSRNFFSRPKENGLATSPGRSSFLGAQAQAPASPVSLAGGRDRPKNQPTSFEVNTIGSTTSSAILSATSPIDSTAKSSPSSAAPSASTRKIGNPNTNRSARTGSKRTPSTSMI